MKTVLIFGGSGFIGKNIVHRVAKNGYKIIIPYQQPVNEAKLRLLGATGQIIPLRFRSIKETIIINQIKKADVIINLKTQWNEKKINYEKGILDFNIKLVDILNINQSIAKFIFFSGIGSEKDNNSKRSVAIYKSEKYIQKNYINSIIIKPSVVIGGGDQFLKNLIPFFKMSFFIPLFGKGQSKFQPVFVDDISKGVNNIIQNSSSKNLIYEFAGNKIFSYKEFYNLISSFIGSKRVIVPIPFILAKFGILILDKINLSPLNREQLRLFEKDNIANNNHKKLLDLNINPQDLREIIKKIIEKN